jgi:hypothetical protein
MPNSNPVTITKDIDIVIKNLKSKKSELKVANKDLDWITKMLIIEKMNGYDYSAHKKITAYARANIKEKSLLEDIEKELNYIKRHLLLEVYRDYGMKIVGGIFAVAAMLVGSVAQIYLLVIAPLGWGLLGAGYMTLVAAGMASSAGSSATNGHNNDKRDALLFGFAVMFLLGTACAIAAGTIGAVIGWMLGTMVHKVVQLVTKPMLSRPDFAPQDQGSAEYVSSTCSIHDGLTMTAGQRLPATNNSTCSAAPSENSQVNTVQSSQPIPDQAITPPPAEVLEGSSYRPCCP